MAFTRQWKKPNWKALWDWGKRVVGFIAVVAPGAGAALSSRDPKEILNAVVIPVAGAVLVHQARRFGDGELNKP